MPLGFDHAHVLDVRVTEGVDQGRLVATPCRVDEVLAFVVEVLDAVGVAVPVAAVLIDVLGPEQLLEVAAEEIGVFGFLVDLLGEVTSSAR